METTVVTVSHQPPHVDRRPSALPILLVSGSSDEREMYAHGLGLYGYSTIQAATVEDAHRLAAEMRPCIVITDFRLSDGQGGPALTRRLRLDVRTRDLPVVILNGCILPRDHERAIEAACDALVAKPCLPDDLSVIIGSFVHRT